MKLDVFVNEVRISIDSRMSVLQACELAGFDVPRFCYHERLSVAGNCRMCLVEVEKAPKLAASCAMPLMAGMKIRTNSPAVKKAREGVLEFLLINHPLDCPICDQGGECDLQDQAMIYGSDRGRFREYKRAIEDKNCGPLVKTIMTRCIHCTRCVRFANEIAGVADLGTSGRGSQIEIGMYIEKLFKSEFSGNVIDLCPVGALTSKPYAFSSRPWELRSVESIDTLDSICSNVRIDTRGYEIMRVLPSLNEELNEEWLSDKSRFSFDGLKRQRLCEPLHRTGFSRLDVSAKPDFVEVSWLDAFDQVRQQFSSAGCYKNNVSGVIGSQCDFESASKLKDLLNLFGKPIIKDQESNLLKEIDFEYLYKFNSAISGIHVSDVCFLLGVDSRKEAAILNLHLRKRYIRGDFKVVNIGSFLDLTFPCEQLGCSTKTLMRVAQGQHELCSVFRKAKKPMIIFGSNFFKDFGEIDGRLVLHFVAKNAGVMAKDWNGLNFLSFQATQVGCSEIGLSSTSQKRSAELHPEDAFSQHYEGVTLDRRMRKYSELVYVLGEGVTEGLPVDCFVVYQGHQGNSNSLRANLILPGSAYTEKEATFLNTEGRIQKTQKVLSAPGKAKEDVFILLAMIESIQPNTRSNKRSTEVESYNETKLTFLDGLDNLKFGVAKIRNRFLGSSQVNNFYLADSISQSSPTMSKCSKQLLSKAPFLI